MSHISNPELIQQLAHLPVNWRSQLDSVWLPLAQQIAESIRRGNFVIGVNGGQGSGKSTFCNGMEILLKECFGLSIATLSIDDFYLTKAERIDLSKNVHPLLITRGVPGTHDVDKAIDTLSMLKKQREIKDNITVPIFDKIMDDRLPPEQQRSISTPIDAVLLEGWCVACPPQSESDLIEPINSLERSEDAKGEWRHWVNQQLGSSYQRWFSLIDYLIVLKVPSLQQVIEWRTLQEADNIKMSQQKSSESALDSNAILRFIQHYERLTLHGLEVIPALANVIVHLNPHHSVESIDYRQKY